MTHLPALEILAWPTMLILEHNAAASLPEAPEA